MPMTWDALTKASIPMTSDGLAQDAIPITRDAVALATAGEMVLPYDHSIVPQETGYWCGPAATQVVLNSRGIYVAERDLARSIGTHTGGTDYVGLMSKTWTGGCRRRGTCRSTCRTIRRLRRSASGSGATWSAASTLAGG